MRQDAKRDDWNRLAELLESAESKGLRSLQPVELQDLAVYLNQLVGRAHGQVYSRQVSRKTRLVEFFGLIVPCTFHKCLPFWLFSLAILIGFSSLAYVATINNPAWSEYMVGPGMRQVMEKFLKAHEPAGQYFAPTAEELGSDGGLSSFLMTHNFQIALLVFATGIVGAIPTLYFMATNAMMLGSVLGLGAYHGKLVLMAAIIAPHGVVEISALVIAGAAGFRLGYALINPGDLLRRDALVIAAREACQLALGTLPMFIFAGLVEGIISPLTFGPFRNEWVRLGFGALSGIALYSWLFAGPLMFAKPEAESER